VRREENIRSQSHRNRLSDEHPGGYASTEVGEKVAVIERNDSGVKGMHSKKPSYLSRRG
jgi:hypothetical protein